MWDKVRKRIVDACDVMDMVMAAVVVIGIVIAVIGIDVYKRQAKAQCQTNHSRWI